ncbi:MAG: ComF family protein [Flavobacteriales bacterium]
MFRELFNLIYPNKCSGCEATLKTNEKSICSDCLFELPRNYYSSIKENPVFKLFWGRVDLEDAASAYYFTKGQRIQYILHSLKYQHNTEVGLKLGLLLGVELCESPYFKNIDVVVPIPLHPKKEKIRGYNQSDFIAKGISNALSVEVDTTSFKRTKHTESQTKKGRFERWENVSEIFSISDKNKFINKHILLIDDVITTGATIEAAAHALKQIEGVKISVAAVASA